MGRLWDGEERVGCCGAAPGPWAVIGKVRLAAPSLLAWGHFPGCPRPDALYGFVHRAYCGAAASWLGVQPVLCAQTLLGRVPTRSSAPQHRNRSQRLREECQSRQQWGHWTGVWGRVMQLCLCLRLTVRRGKCLPLSWPCCPHL